MSRFLLTVGALVAVAVPARADRVGPAASAAERALRVPVVFVGKVAAIEKATVEAEPYPGAGTKLAYTVAVVKVETALAGADGMTHVKIGFAPMRRYAITLKDGQSALFFVAKHHDAPFHVIPYMTPPIDTAEGGYKQQLEGATAALAVVADPGKALKAEKAEDRAAAAAAIVFKLRHPPEEAPKGNEAILLAADESRTILKALAGAAWKEDRHDLTLNGFRSFVLLGLTDADGWKPPAAEAGKDYVETTRAAFAAWLDGPGKEYRIKKLVPKK